MATGSIVPDGRGGYRIQINGLTVGFAGDKATAERTLADLLADMQRGTR